MTALEALFANGQIVYLAFAFLILEIIAIAVIVKTTALKRSLFLNALSGLSLMAALFFALSGFHFLWIAAAMTGGFLAHIADLFTRLKKR